MSAGASDASSAVGAAVSASKADMESIAMETVRVACLKALVVLQNAKMAHYCLLAAYTASRILDDFGVPYRVVAGYTNMPGLELSSPHVWLETGDLVTDMALHSTSISAPVSTADGAGGGAFAPGQRLPPRGVVLLGTGVGFMEGWLKPEFTLTQLYPLLAGGLSIDELKAQSMNLQSYYSGAPKFVQDVINEALEAARSAQKEIKLRVSLSG